MEVQNTQLVKDAYAAFERGDIPSLLGMLSEDVQWQAVIGTEGKVPTSGLRQGRGGVGQFFSQLGESVAFDAFEPREFIAQGDQVAVIGRYKARAVTTQKGWDVEWVMVFTVRNGKITRFREYTDSHALVTAFQ